MIFHLIVSCWILTQRPPVKPPHTPPASCTRTALSCPSFPPGPWCYPKSGTGPGLVHWPTHWTSMQTSTDLSSLTPSVGTSLNANNSLNFTAWEPEVGPSCCGLGSRCSCLSPITATHHLLQRQKAMTGWQSIIVLSQTCGCIAA